MRTFFRYKNHCIKLFGNLNSLAFHFDICILCCTRQWLPIQQQVGGITIRTFSKGLPYLVPVSIYTVYLYTYMCVYTTRLYFAIYGEEGNKISWAFHENLRVLRCFEALVAGIVCVCFIALCTIRNEYRMWNVSKLFFSLIYVRKSACISKTNENLEFCSLHRVLCRLAPVI